MKLLEKLKDRRFLTIFAIVLVILSGVFYASLLAVPFLPFSAIGRGGIATALVIAGEASFWIGAAILGKQVIDRYRIYLNPINWFRRRKTERPDADNENGPPGSDSGTT